VGGCSGGSGGNMKRDALDERLMKRVILTSGFVESPKLIPPTIFGAMRVVP